MNLYLANASDPGFWDLELKKAISAAAAKGDTREQKEHVWILALDCLYHFAPSRIPIFEFTCQKLDASLMAFDLVMSPSTSLLQRLLLRVLALILGAPAGNFITMVEYEEQLVKAGFSRDGIKFEDVSGRVFPGLAQFIERRDDEWRTFTGQGIGPYKTFARILRWWEKTGFIRGVIVIARR